MPLIQHVYPWDSQPQEAVEAGTDSSLFSQLRFLVNGNVPAPINLIPGTYSQTPTVFGAPSTRPTDRGLGVVCSANADGLEYPCASFIASNQRLTFLMVMRKDVAFAAGGVWAFNFGNVTNVGFTSNFGAKIAAATGRSGNYWQGAEEVTEGALNSHHVYVGTFTERVGGSLTLTLWKDGINQNSNVDSTNIDLDATFVSLGNRTGFLPNATKCDNPISIAAIWHRLLSNAEIAEVSANPWQLFAPLTQYVPTSSGVPMPTLGIPTFVPGSLTSSGFRPRFPVTWA